MRTGLRVFKRQGWPLSAMLVGPWSGGLLLSLALRLTAGSSTETYILAHYDSLHTLLASLLSLYFVLAFMKWVVGKRPPDSKSAETRTLAPRGLSTGQMFAWGLLGILLIPIIVVISTMPYQASLVEALTHAFHGDPAMHAGFLWLVSLSTLIMTPIMVLWLVWMWRTWATHKTVQTETEPWEYEYE